MLLLIGGFRVDSAGMTISSGGLAVTAGITVWGSDVNVDSGNIYIHDKGNHLHR